MASSTPDWDLDHYFDFEQATLPVAEEDGALTPYALPEDNVNFPAFGAEQALDFDPFNSVDGLHSAQNELEILRTNSGDVPEGTARFHVPSDPCDYCRSRQLECFINRGWLGCMPCLALFRECSFTSTGAPNMVSGLDTLQSVPESSAQDTGALTGSRELASMSGPLSELSRSSIKTGNRFPREALLILKGWLREHSDHPYPTDEERSELKEQTGLTHTQILNWLANARRRGKVPRRAPSPAAGIRSNTRPIDMPANPTRSNNPSLRGLTPIDRYKASPPEYEPALMSDIANAVANSNLSQGTRELSVSRRHSRHDSSASSIRSEKRAPSVSSLETSRSSNSFSTPRSIGSRASLLSRSSIGKKDRRRRKGAAPAATRQDSSDASRLFQCTFCTDTFKSKYDWTRHEKSLHLSLEKWICSPSGPVETCPNTGLKRCVFCGVLSAQDPTKEHMETHNHSACAEKRPEDRLFFRKDHLRQHLRLVHNCTLDDTKEHWRFQITTLKSRCGFCAAEFTTWDERADHLSKHFRSGARMKDWKGDWGFDPAVAAQITNSVPYPFLIDMEATSMFPFSASDPASMCCIQPAHTSGASDISCTCTVLSKADCGSSNCHTYWDLLSGQLGHYFKMQMQNGIVPSDEMLQRQARCIWFGEDDSWDQTPADNEQWLALFKQKVGLDMNGTSAVESQGRGRNCGCSAVQELETRGTEPPEEPVVGDFNFEEFFLQEMEGLELGNASFLGAG